jgi:hypothetical protein
MKKPGEVSHLQEVMTFGTNVVGLHLCVYLEGDEVELEDIPFLQAAMERWGSEGKDVSMFKMLCTNIRLNYCLKRDSISVADRANRKQVKSGNAARYRALKRTRLAIVMAFLLVEFGYAIKLPSTNDWNICYATWETAYAMPILERHVQMSSVVEELSVLAEDKVHFEKLKVLCSTYKEAIKEEKQKLDKAGETLSTLDLRKASNPEEKRVIQLARNKISARLCRVSKRFLATILMGLGGLIANSYYNPAGDVHMLARASKSSLKSASLVESTRGRCATTEGTVLTEAADSKVERTDGLIAGPPDEDACDILEGLGPVQCEVPEGFDPVPDVDLDEVAPSCKRAKYERYVEEVGDVDPISDFCNLFCIDSDVPILTEPEGLNSISEEDNVWVSQVI